jgi:probable phosphoglycerate mutase
VIDPEEAVNEKRTPRVFIIRHGETDWSLNGRHTGRTDIGLTEHGRELASRLGKFLEPEHFSLVLTSPLTRAGETCRLAGFGERAVADPDLEEWDYGDYEGLTRSEIEDRNPGWVVFRDGCPGGERPEDVRERVDRVIARIRAAQGDVCAFTHGHLLRVLGVRWIDLPVTAGRNVAATTASVGVLTFHYGMPVIQRWNWRPEL